MLFMWQLMNINRCNKFYPTKRQYSMNGSTHNGRKFLFPDIFCIEGEHILKSCCFNSISYEHRTVECSRFIANEMEALSALLLPALEAGGSPPRSFKRMPPPPWGPPRSKFVKFAPQFFEFFCSYIFSGF